MINVYECIEREMLNDKDQTLYILQGFPFAVYAAIENIGISHLLKNKYDKYIDYHILEEKGVSKSLLMALKHLKSQHGYFMRNLLHCLKLLLILVFIKVE